MCNGSTNALGAFSSSSNLDTPNIYGGYGVMAAQDSVAVSVRVRIPLAAHLKPFLCWSGFCLTKIWHSYILTLCQKTSNIGVQKMTLKEFLEKGDHTGFRLAVGYCVALKHGLMGFFPAIESESCEMVTTIDLELLKRVWKTLTPRRSELQTQLLYVNPNTGVAFSILGSDEYNLEKSEQYQILTQARFDELVRGKKPAFKWAPGLVGDDMSRTEFLETLVAAAPA